MFRKLLGFIISRNFQITGTSRSSFSWRFYEKTKSFSWRCRYCRTGSRRSVEPKLLFALAASFSFKDFGISEERFKNAEKAVDEFDARDDEQRGWEVLREEKDFRALRRRLAGDRELYEYKCAGTYWDISPRSFLDAQNDITYRTEWDANILSLELLDEQNEHELLRWVSKFPYPLHAREYVYVRRTWISDDKKVVVIESEVVPEEVVPSAPKTKNVRVGTYTSRMAIRSHDDWNEHGVDYILTYSDNPEANIPRYIYNWMVNQGGPYFLKQVHKAALEIEKSGKEIRSVLERLSSKKLDEMKLQVPESSEEEEEAMEEEVLDENDEKKEGVAAKIQNIMPGLRNIKSKTFQNSVPESSLLS